MKRFYIAVGSTAVNALYVLVNRYREYGSLIGSNGTGEDFFVGIDSEEAVVDKFQSLTTNRKWLIGLHMGLDEALLPLTKVAHPSWTEFEQYEKTGVGGIRRRSFRTMTFLRNQDFVEMLDRYAEGDLVVLVGSAFGGTSTGSYWNIATWLRWKMNRNGYSKDLYGFVIFPDASQWQKCCGGQGAYVNMSTNVCDFLRDMSQIRIENTILANVSDDFKFCPVSLPKANGNQESNPDRFGIGGTGRIAAGRADDASLASFLPTESLFLLSTNNKGQRAVSELVADELFLFAKLEVGRQQLERKLIDQGPKGQTAHGGAEGFSEFHFVSARTKRKKMFLNCIYELQKERIKQLSSMAEWTGSPSPAWQKLEIEMVAAFDAIGRSLAEGSKDAVRGLINGVLDGSKSQAEIQASLNSLMGDQEKASFPDGYPYHTPSEFWGEILKKAKKACEDNDQLFLQYPSTNEVPFRMKQAENLFNKIFSPIKTKRDHFSALEKRLREAISEFPGRILAEYHRRRDLPFWTMLGGRTKANVDAEFKGQAADKLLDLLKVYAELVNCRNTPASSETFDALSRRYASGIPNEGDISGLQGVSLDCISNPNLSSDERRKFDVDFKDYKNDLYKPQYLYDDAIRILGYESLPLEQRDRAVKGDGEQKLDEYVTDAISQVYPKRASTESGTIMKQPLWDGIEAASGGRSQKSTYRQRSVWGIADPALGPCSVPFIAETKAGEQKETAGNGRLPVNVLWEKIRKFPEWGRVFRMKNEADDNNPFDTSKEFERDIQRVNLPPAGMRIDDFWMGDLQFDRSIQDFLSENYEGMTSILSGQVQRILRQEGDDKDYARLFRFPEAVQIGLVLGVVSGKLAEKFATRDERDSYKVVDTGTKEECRIPLACLENGYLKEATGDMVVWARQFIKSHATIFSDKNSGAEEFFGDLRKIEDSCLSFSPSNAQRSFQLDFDLKSDSEQFGIRSLGTLKRISSEIRTIVAVETFREG